MSKKRVVITETTGRQYEQIIDSNDDPRFYYDLPFTQSNVQSTRVTDVTDND